MARKSEAMKDYEIIADFDKRATAWELKNNENRERYKSTKLFIYEEDGQFTDEEKKEYKNDNRPLLSFNQLPRIISNVAAEFAENIPDYEICTDQNVEVKQEVIDTIIGLLRQISYNSKNDQIARQCFKNAATGGYGAIRVCVDRENPRSFNKIIRNEFVENPLNCGWDPACESITKEDGRFCYMATLLDKDKFKDKYPGVDIPTNDINKDFTFYWNKTENDVVVVDYWKKEFRNIDIVLLSDQTVVEKSKADEIIREKNKAIKLRNEMFPADQLEKITIVDEDTVEEYDIMYYRMIKDKILERYKWPGKLLGVIRWPGLVENYENKEQLFGLVYWAISAQRAYNFARNEFLYRLKTDGYAQWLVTTQHIAGKTDIWNNPRASKSALIYNPSPDGKVPQRFDPNSGNLSSIQAEIAQSHADIQSITGRFDPNSGAQGNEISGRAIGMRQSSGNLNVKEFFDNSKAALEALARVNVDLIPKVYDTTRTINIIKQNGESGATKINDGNIDMPTENFYANVKVKMDASFEIQQRDNLLTLMNITNANPNLQKIAYDVILKNLNMQDAGQLVTRFKRYIEPQIAIDEGSQDPIVKRNMQMQMQQQQQQQQLAQQATMMQMQAQKLDMLEKQQDLMLNKLKVTSEVQGNNVKDEAVRLNADANMMNAQTNRGEAVLNGLHESQKLQVEEDRANMELQTEALRAMTALSKPGEKEEIK